MPTNSTITIHNQTVLIHPIMDEYYVASPSFKRSSAFAHTKGQVTAEIAHAHMKSARETPEETLSAALGQLQASVA